MKLLISPAKKMRVEADFLPPQSQPPFLEKSAQLLEYLRGLSLSELKRLLACNESLAQEAWRNFRSLDLENGQTPALLAYHGIQYQYMAPGLFTQEQLDYVGDRLRILSGFYGVLRPFDGVSPYRLEMQARMKTSFCKSLYDFWGDSLGNFLAAEDSVLVNLASEEYAKAVRSAIKGKARFITCVFAEEPEPGKLVEKGVYVKMARGEMVRFAAERQLQTPEELQAFNRLGYSFAPPAVRGGGLCVPPDGAAGICKNFSGRIKIVVRNLQEMVGMIVPWKRNAGGRLRQPPGTFRAGVRGTPWKGTAMKVLRIVRNLVLLVLALCLCAVLALAFLGWQMYTRALEAMPLDQRVRQVQSQKSYTTFEELPDTYVDAVIAAEDHRFYEHGGIDLIAIGRALVNDIKAMSFVEGGSTITQQLAKNLYFTQEKELTRKVAEMFMAFHIEANYSKEEIFELYVNSIYFGNGCYDVASASQSYFGVKPSQMDENQCTLLAGIPNAPSVYDLHVNPDLAVQRQRQVVNLMVKYEYLTETQASAILPAA